MIDSVESYRVAQWATGNIGTHALREVLRHPGMSLAGLYVHDDAKAGRDAGDLCGLGKTGVTATRDIDAILASGADCVLYMPLTCDLDQVCRILSAGINIVTTCGEFHRPASMPTEVRQRVETACAEGNSSIHSTGSSPGFITEALPLVLTSLQRKLTNLTIDEYANISIRDSPALLFEVMGMGRAPSSFDEQALTHARTSFGPSLLALADSLGLPADSVQAAGEVGTARTTTHIAAGTIEAGTVAAQRISASLMRDGAPLITFRATWYCTTDLDTDWDTRENGWRVRVDGDTPLDIGISFPVALEDLAPMTPGLTANRAVNAVPVVCQAPAGVRTTADLPQVIARLA